MKSYIIAANILVASTLPASAFGISIDFGAGGGNAVVCVVSDVTLLASSDADCSAAGGTVTHKVEQVVTPTN